MDSLQITVVVCTYLGESRVTTALDSLAEQTLSPSAFEVLVVQNGPDCGTPDVVRSWSRSHPDHRVRLLQCARPGAGHARNLALAAARGSFVTHLDDDDAVTPTFLQGLLEVSGPGTVAVAPIGDVLVRSDGRWAEPDFTTYQARSLRGHLGPTVDLGDALSPLGANAAKLLPTDRARRTTYDETLRSGEDVVYWAEQVALEPFAWRIVDERSGAAYLRVVREGSLGRQADSYDFCVTQRLDCIARLVALRAESDEARQVMTYLVAGQSGFLHRYLTTHPEHHHHVVHDARARGLGGSIPWTEVNQGLARTLAVLYAFPPFLDTSGLVAAKRLAERGEPFDLICQDMTNIRVVDRGSTAIAGEFLADRHVVGGDAATHWWAEVRRFAERTLEAVEEHDRRHPPYDTLYSRAMSVQSHLAAALVKARQPQIRWIAEFSDPLLKDSDGRDREPVVGADWLAEELRSVLARAGFAQPPEVDRFYEWAELVVYATADEIVFTNEHQRDLMLGYCRDRRLADRAAAVARVERHPCPEARHYATPTPGSSLRSGVVNIGYFGVFYATRGPEDVVAALEELTIEERARLRFHVFTRDPELLAVDMVRRGVADAVVAHPYVPYLEFLGLTTRFQVLMVNDASTLDHYPVNPYLPSKLADYRGSGTDIWSLVEPGSILSAEQTEYSSPIGDVAAAVAQLRKMLARAAVPPGPAGPHAQEVATR